MRNHGAFSLYRDRPQDLSLQVDFVTTLRFPYVEIGHKIWTR